MFIDAVGAYGRLANIEDWKAGKDFFSVTHQRYFSIRDANYIRLEGYAGIYFYNGYDGRALFFVSLISNSGENQ